LFCFSLILVLSLACVKKCIIVVIMTRRLSLLLIFAVIYIAQGYTNPVLPGFMDFRYLSTEVIGGFTGVMLGVFAQENSLNAYADFDWFDYEVPGQ